MLGCWVRDRRFKSQVICHKAQTVETSLYVALLSIPNDDASIDTARAELLYTSSAAREDPEGTDGVLMGRGQLRIVLGLTPQVHLPKHVPRRVFDGSSAWALL